MPAEAERNISFRDVSNLMHEVAKHFNCRVQITLGMPLVHPSAQQFYVRAAVLRPDGRNNWLDVLGTSAPWPNIDSKTMAGLMFKLVWDLQAKMGEAEEEEERKARTQDRLL